jgi:hypothetical protein
MLTARAENYGIKDIKHIRGRIYSLTMDKTEVIDGKEIIADGQYRAVLLINSFDYYLDRYHMSKNRPSLIICFDHNTCVPIPVLSVHYGHLAASYELPEVIHDIETQRHTKVGSKVFVGMYLSGLRQAQAMMQEFPPSTKTRYKQRITTLNKRKVGTPVKG